MTPNPLRLRMSYTNDKGKKFAITCSNDLYSLEYDDIKHIWPVFHRVFSDFLNVKYALDKFHLTVEPCKGRPTETQKKETLDLCFGTDAQLSQLLNCKDKKELNETLTRGVEGVDRDEEAGRDKEAEGDKGVEGVERGEEARRDEGAEGFLQTHVWLEEETKGHHLNKLAEEFSLKVSSDTYPPAAITSYLKGVAGPKEAIKNIADIGATVH